LITEFDAVNPEGMLVKHQRMSNKTFLVYFSPATKLCSIRIFLLW